MAQIPITGASGTLPTTAAAIYTLPPSQNTPYATIDNIFFTNTVDDQDFTITLYQKAVGSSSAKVLWSFNFKGAKSVVDTDIKKLVFGDSIMAVCNRSTVQYVVNGYYELSA